MKRRHAERISAMNLVCRGGCRARRSVGTAPTVADKMSFRCRRR